MQISSTSGRFSDSLWAVIVFKSWPLVPSWLLKQTLGILFIGAQIHGAETVELGKGSYRLKLPEGVRPLPKEISKMEEQKGATPTNQWWSSLVWERFSQNMFPHPLAMVCHEGGLAVTYPGAAIDARSGNIMGGGVSKGGDFVIGHSEVSQFSDAKLADYSAWFVSSIFEKERCRLQTTFGHGSPYVYCKIEGGSPMLRFAHQPIIWSGQFGQKTLGLTVRGNHYGIFGANGSSWNASDNQTLINQDHKGYFSIALLPDRSEETLQLFSEAAHRHVVATKVSPTVAHGVLKSHYEITTKAMEGTEGKTLTALYPHQWKYTPDPLLDQKYRSVRGEMKLLRASSFQTHVPIQGLLPMLPSEGIPDRERMLSYLNKEIQAAPNDFADTYWEGKYLGKLATLAGIAEVMGQQKIRAHFITIMRERLENWLVASPGEKAPLFYYDSTWGTLVGSPASYGSDDQINDHHFHYGYFIRAAAEVARFDPTWVNDWGAMVELLIRDIASTNPRDPLFPHLRCFDLYAGHSWASGHAKFGDGNNQESSSESMNAWYGMMLWGEVTQNQALRDTGIFLYNTERTAVEEYWFDVSQTNFPKDFPNVALGMIWGGKGAFATWFSGDIDCIHGINWLPFTPASIYMGRHPDYVKRNHARIVEKRPKGDNYNNGWGDLIVMFNALNDPSMAVAYLDDHPDCSLEGGNTHAFMYHWIHTLDQLGRNDRRVRADHPFTNVYFKEGKKTYVTYNGGEKPLKVSFSDGHEVLANPKGLTVSSSEVSD